MGIHFGGPRRTAESVITKFGLMRSERGEIFWRKTLINETTAQLSDLERLRLQVYPLCFDVLINSKECLKKCCAFKFFRIMFSSLICIY